MMELSHSLERADNTREVELTFSFGFLTVSLGSAPVIRSVMAFKTVNFVGHLALLLFEIGFKLRQSSVLRCHDVGHQSFEIGLTVKILRIVVEGTARE
ncbi:hypothetical protein Tco_0305289 [Tanacetum coccineum]